MASFPHSKAPLRRPNLIQFGVLPPHEIKALSVCKVEHAEVYEEGGQLAGKVKTGGLADRRMGTTEREFKCATCGEGMTECSGHFGHIELSAPVYHIGFLGRMKKILESICVQCGKLLINQYDDQRIVSILRHTRNPAKRLAEVHKIAKTRRICEEDPDPETVDPSKPEKKGHGGCGHAQPLIRREGLKLFLVYNQKRSEDNPAPQSDRRQFSAGSCLQLLRKIPNEDLLTLGLHPTEAHPQWMILTVLPVPPPPVRPSISTGMLRSEDDLTYKLAEILKANINLKRLESEGAPGHVTSEAESLLQWHIATYMDNDLPGQPQALQKSGRPVKSIRARLKGKEGRLRGNLMGKRVDFSARTVITGDPNLALDQVGVPYSIARNLTYPERVTPYNIDYLQNLVKNGPNEYPGARYVVRDTGDRIDLRYNRRQECILQSGWIVERHLKDGDYVLFNRQPSLHKMSMMAHRVKLMHYSTFRLNLSVTVVPIMRSDFDGDEMNLHVPQSEETRAELKEIASVSKQIVSPQSNRPVMGIIQDTLLGIRKFTLRDCFMDREFVQNILLWVPDWDGVVPPPTILKPKPLWTGKQIISMLIPAGINLEKGDEDDPTSIPYQDKSILIDDGELIYGILNKGIVGASAQGGLVHVIFRERGAEATKIFIGGVQTVVNYWLLHNGFSIGIGDTVPDKGTMEAITGFVSHAKAEVANLIQMAQEDRLEQEPGMTIRESFEAKVRKALDKARDDAGKKAQVSLKDDNNVKQMVSAGSKGTFINISQMSALVGQSAVEGKRIAFGFKYRTLPHFTKDDYSPESRGFVENSYLRGLTPQEFFFHAVSGREGLIDTAVKTAETGYIQRRLVKALEDVQVSYDGTVRNSLGDVVQFVYGEDGMDGAMLEFQNIDYVRLKNDDFDRMYKVDVMDPAWRFKEGTLQIGLADSSIDLQALLDEEYRQLLEDRELLRTYIFKDGSNRKALPVNIKRILKNAQQIFHIDVRKPSDLPPADIVVGVQELLKRLVVVRGDDALTEEAQQNATLMFQILVRSNFASKRILQEFHLNKEAFEWVLGEVESKFNQSIVHPGEMCGTLAAQSIGEPATQMTLNTFHFAGVSSKNVTLGVPRLKEIINVARNIKTPSLKVFLSPEIASDQRKAKQLSTELAHTTLRTVVSSSQIFYDPNPTTTIIEEDRDFVEATFAIPDEEMEQNITRQSEWLLRLELDRAKMLDKNLEMAYVAGKISEIFQNDLFVMWSEDTAEKLVIRCRPLRDKDDDDDIEIEEDIFLKQLEQSMLSSITLRGVEGVERVYMIKEKKVTITPAGEFNPAGDVEWVLETDGTNLRKVLCVDGVDSRRTVSNNCVEIFDTLGIEAARASVFQELRNVIEFESSYVNYRHLYLLCDLMTNRGSLMSITRHGINRAETGALMRCSFEETVEILMDAAANGEQDACTAVAENVLLGQVAPMGTGCFEIALDDEALKDVVVDHRLPTVAFMPHGIDGAMTPGGAMTPYADYADGRTPARPYEEALPMAAFSPVVHPGQEDFTGPSNPFASGYGAASPYGAGLGSGPHYSPNSPSYGPTSPRYGGTSPAFASPYGAQSPWVDRMSVGYSPTSPGIHASPASPAFSPSSPRFSPTSPMGRPTGASTGRWGAASPAFSPSSPRFSPQSPRFSPTSPSFSPQSPRFSPTSPNFAAASPRFSPSSPRFSPVSPAFSPSQGGPKASPTYSPASPAFSPTSPQMHGVNGMSPKSPAWSPTSPNAFTPTSPATNGRTNGLGSTNGGTRYNSSPTWSR
ncbi:beta and beta-prime subunits of DNA dependent RNA-polymerase [Atractiella rhizophila]|nr:beta and beta-prime subunits of DNA dependent RNA-polymerase [Atractiella rhizophila]